MGMYLARRQLQISLEAARKTRVLNKQIIAQQQYLDEWVNNPDNRQFDYFDEVCRAYQMLTVSPVQPSLTDVQNKLDDLQALNKAIMSYDVADLIQRAKIHMEYASPLAIALGTSFAMIGLGIIITSLVFLACPALAVVGLLAVISGCAAVLIGASKTPSDRTYTLFNVAKAIDPMVDMDRDLFERDAAKIERSLNAMSI